MRPARPQDSTQAAELFYSTGPQALNLAFGSRDKACSIIRRLVELPANPMSFEYTTVAEIEGRVAGILTLLDRSAESLTHAGMALALFKICGPLPLLSRLPVYLRLSRMSEIVSADELCIADVAVSAKIRGKGVGKVLMEEAERVARYRGYRLLSLYVLADNGEAIRFYLKLGYFIDKAIIDPWLHRRHGFKGFLRMTKRIIL